MANGFLCTVVRRDASMITVLSSVAVPDLRDRVVIPIRHRRRRSIWPRSTWTGVWMDSRHTNPEPEAEGENVLPSGRIRELGPT